MNDKLPPFDFRLTIRGLGPGPGMRGILPFRAISNRIFEFFDATARAGTALLTARRKTQNTTCWPKGQHVCVDYS
jgi:hypothetical protein